MEGKKIEYDMIGNVLFQISQKVENERPNFSVRLRSGRLFNNCQVDWTSSKCVKKGYVCLSINENGNNVLICWIDNKEAKVVYPELYIDTLTVHYNRKNR